MSEQQPLLLDLFCGAGGAGVGYARAGFRVVGCDLDAKPLRHNPHECYVGDALDTLDTLLAGGLWQGYHLRDFAAIHASPPCQAYSVSKGLSRGTAPRHIQGIERRLERAGRPYIIENVAGAVRELPSSVLLCGVAFGLHVYRHRLFESNVLLFAPGPCSHPRHLLPGYVCVYGHVVRGRQTGNRNNHYDRLHAADARAAMGIDWMTLPEMAQAIPPSYTEWLGRQLMTALANTTSTREAVPA